MVRVDQYRVMHVMWPACGDLSSNSDVELQKKMNGENNKESSAEVTDVDAVG